MKSGLEHQVTAWKRRRSERTTVAGVSSGQAQKSPRTFQAAADDHAWEGIPLSSTRTRNLMESASVVERRCHLLNCRSRSSLGVGVVRSTVSRAATSLKVMRKSSGW